MALLSRRYTGERGTYSHCALSTFAETTKSPPKDQTYCPKAGDYVYLTKRYLRCSWMHHEQSITLLPLMQCMQLVQGSDTFLYFELMDGHEIPNWKYNPSNRMLYAAIKDKEDKRHWELYHPLEFSIHLCEAPNTIDNL